ncbi:protein kinase domain-containing protein [Streptomyces sp. CA-250714]|uniref:protein kinase domain-containing protein n=1 Tax=Streptomyces sp. CA-250714 TaxID=3240060 RepID=UPI003D93520E
MRGRRLNDRYELIDLLGAGGMGEVWRARDLRLHREVAVKVFMPQPGAAEDTDREELLARFQREARSAAALDSPHIVAVHDHGTDGGTPFLVMALVHGASLHEVLRDSGRVPLADALRWTADVCRALGAAHRAGLVHRDIKPANIMIERHEGEGTGRAKVVDFGIAKVIEARATDPRLTTTGQLPFGSVLYMAPEQFRQTGVDGRTDLYALGCVLYELLVGRPPYTGSAAGVMFNHLHDTPLRPTRARAELPPSADRLVLTLTARDPADRPANAAEALERVQDVARTVREDGRTLAAPGQDAAPEPSPAPEAVSASAPELEPRPHVGDRRPASPGPDTPYRRPLVPALRRGAPAPPARSGAARVWRDAEWTPTFARISRLVPDRGRQVTVVLSLAYVLIVVAVILLSR